MLFDINQRSKPIIKWAGGKSGVLQQLQNHFPQSFSRYLEPFIGGGAVFFALDQLFQNTQNIINDANPEIYNLYLQTRDRPNELMACLDELEKLYAEGFYYQLRSQLPVNKVEQAARTIFLNKTGFNGLYRQNSKGLFNVPFGKRLKCPELYDKKNFLDVSARLSRALICNLDFEKVIDQAQAGDFIYCDPPYEPLNSTSSFNAYQANGFSRDQQIRLKECCFRAVERGAKVLISNSSAEFILDLYKDFAIYEILAKRAINSAGAKRGAVAEVLIDLNKFKTSNKYELSLQKPKAKVQSLISSPKKIKNNSF